MLYNSVFINDRLDSSGLDYVVYKLSHNKTKNIIKDLNRKIKFLKKHNFLCYYSRNVFIEKFVNMFTYELYNKKEENNKIINFYDFMRSIKDNKESDREYRGYIQSILSDLSKSVHEYHVYSALLHKHNFKKINSKMTKDEFISIFRQKYSNDLYECQNKNIMLLQYENLRKHFNKLVDDVLGVGYYNEGLDVYSCDEFTCRDLKTSFKKRWYKG